MRTIKPEQHGTNTGYGYGCRDDCCRLAHNAAVVASKHRKGERANLRIHIEDVEWLIEAREHPDNIAKRLGVQRKSLERALQRKGRNDLLERMSRLVAA